MIAVKDKGLVDLHYTDDGEEECDVKPLHFKVWASRHLRKRRKFLGCS